MQNKIREQNRISNNLRVASTGAAAAQPARSIVLDFQARYRGRLEERIRLKRRALAAARAEAIASVLRAVDRVEAARGEIDPEKASALVETLYVSLARLKRGCDGASAQDEHGALQSAHRRLEALIASLNSGDASSSPR